MQNSYLIAILAHLSILFFSLLAIAQGYNEVRDEKGKLRAFYRDVAPVVEALNPEQLERFRIESRKAFSNDNALDPMPRLLSEAEFKTLEKGVDQRAKALVAFLKDYFSGERTFEKAGIIPKGLVDRIASRNGDHLFQGHVRPEEINFFYGPDIIRDQNGVWRVIEDNPGFIGGIGDLKLAQEFLLRQFPQFQDKLRIRNADDFYENISTLFKLRAAQNGGRAIIYMQPPYADNEDYRIQELLSAYDIEVITPKTAHKKLVMKEEGLFLDYFVKGQRVLEKVGFLFLNGEHAWIDTADPRSHVRNTLEAAQDMLTSKEVLPFYRRQVQNILENPDPQTGLPDMKRLEELVDRHSPYAWRSRAKIPGLTQAILDGKVSVNYTPGIDFIGDKQFYLYVEDLIRFYLGQEPIIRNIPTTSLANSRGQLDSKAYRQIMQDFSKFVVKKVDGRGGDGVWVGPKTQAADLNKLQQRIKANPAHYISQDYLYLSELNGNITDLRLITMVMNGKSFVAPTPWGRGLPKSGNGKVNLSDQGREVAVFVVEKGAPVTSSTPKILRCNAVLGARSRAK